MEAYVDDMMIKTTKDEHLKYTTILKFIHTHNGVEYESLIIDFRLGKAYDNHVKCDP